MKFSHLATLCVAAVVLAGCADTTKSFIRSKDFRSAPKAEYRPTGVASPFADIADMPNWTSDINGAVAFSAENRLETVVFFQDSSAKSQSVKKVLNDGEAARALDGKQKVVVDINAAPDVAARYGINSAPTVLKLSPTGSALIQTDKATKGSVLTVIR